MTEKRAGAAVVWRVGAAVAAELRSYGNLFRALRKWRNVPPGAHAFGYSKGGLSLPIALTIVSVVELVIVHVILPWMWLRIVLLVLTVWGVLFMLGFFATRVVNPHFVANGELRLRWGERTVLATPCSNIVSAVRHVNHAHSQPVADGQKLVLTQLQSTNVLIRFAQPVEASAPVSKKHLPDDFHATEVYLYVDDPGAFVEKLGDRSDAAAG